MSFCTETKNELSRIILNNIYSKEAKLYAYIQNIGAISIKGKGKVNLFLETEEASIARRIYKLFKDVFNINTQIIIKKNPLGKKSTSYNITIPEYDQTSIILDYFDIIDFSLNPAKTEEDIFCRISKDTLKDYFRAVFLSCGYISDPAKNYQLEFVLKDDVYANILLSLAKTLNIILKYSKRKEKHIVYTKDSEIIISFLGIIGAHSSVLKIENTKVIKEVRNNANRRTNCDTANMDKTIETSQRHMDIINKIRKYGSLNDLSDDLKELIILREQFPLASLKELGEMSTPIVSRSVINNRFKKLEKIAQRL